jgi:hypothetical protein
MGGAWTGLEQLDGTRDFTYAFFFQVFTDRSILLF